MRYIKNPELREWVKESLRKTIFQKAHALSVQTGCEVLVKLDDIIDTAECQYYATGALQKTYNNNQLKKSASEVEVAGETGLPVTKTLDQASQSSSDDGDEDEGGDEDGHRKVSTSTSNLPGSPASTNQDVIHQGHANDDLIEDDMDEDDYEDENDEMDSDDNSQLLTQLAFDGLNARRVNLPERATDSNDKGTKDEAQKTSVDPVDSMVQNILKSVDSNNSGIRIVMKKKSEPNHPPPGDPVDSLVKHILKVGGGVKPSIEKERETQIRPPHGRSPSTIGESSTNPSASIASPSRPKPAMSPSIRPYQCGVCQKTFGSIQVLSRHAQTFHGMNRAMRYYCNICGQSYRLAQYLQTHVKMHDTVTVAPVLCKVCGMGYYSNAALKQHELTHSTPSLPSELTHSSSSLPSELTRSTSTMSSAPSHTLSSPPDEQAESKPNPRLQLSQTSSISGPKPVQTSTSSLKSSRPVEHSPTETKRFKQSSPSDTKEDIKDESYHEPKQYHCLVCGMAFEEGEQLEEHVMKKHMQSESDEPQSSIEASPVKHASAANSSPEDNHTDNDDQPQNTTTPEERHIKEEVITPPPPPLSLQSFDIPSTSESSFMSAGPMTTSFPPFSALDNASFGIPHSQSLPFPPPPGPLLNPNANITSVLEQALPSLLPGISLLSNPTQLPMSHAATSIAQSEGPIPMVSQDGRFTCDICGNSYKYNCTLKEHRLTHAQTPLFSCKICNQAFSRQRQLRDHMFRHSGAYPYHCKLCGKGFVRPSILRRHETDRHKQAFENMS